MKLYLTRLGFRLENTGGNVQAWRLDVAPKAYILLSTNEGEAFDNPDAPVWCWTLYQDDRPDGIGGDNLTLEAAAMWAKAYSLSHKMKGV